MKTLKCTLYVSIVCVLAGCAGQSPMQDTASISQQTTTTPATRSKPTTNSQTADATTKAACEALRTAAMKPIASKEDMDAWLRAKTACLTFENSRATP